MAKIKKDDLVQVISGKDKGKQGKVLRVFPTDERVLVEGVNRVTKHLRAGQESTSVRDRVPVAKTKYSLS